MLSVMPITMGGEMNYWLAAWETGIYAITSSAGIGAPLAMARIDSE
jgi:hypothetical protein